MKMFYCLGDAIKSIMVDDNYAIIMRDGCRRDPKTVKPRRKTKNAIPHQNLP